MRRVENDAFWKLELVVLCMSGIGTHRISTICSSGQGYKVEAKRCGGISDLTP